jgi:hypothetical protein
MSDKKVIVTVPAKIAFDGVNVEQLVAGAVYEGDKAELLLKFEFGQVVEVDQTPAAPVDEAPKPKAPAKGKKAKK